MRKYKAWDKEIHRMGEVISINFEDEIVVYRDWEYGISEEVPFGDVEFLQSTGLFDKNGTEIYEGDIVKHDPVPNLFISNTYFEIIQARSGEWRMDSYIGGQVLAFSNHEVGVIGNKFEHPHLLEEDKSND